MCDHLTFFVQSQRNRKTPVFLFSPLNRSPVLLLLPVLLVLQPVVFGTQTVAPLPSVAHVWSTKTTQRSKPWYSSVPTKMAGFAGCPSPHSFQWHFLGNLTHTHLAKSGQVTSLFGHDSPYQSPGTTIPDWMGETVQSGVQTNHVHCCRGSWGLIYIYI